MKEVGEKQMGSYEVSPFGGKRKADQKFQMLKRRRLWFEKTTGFMILDIPENTINRLLGKWKMNESMNRDRFKSHDLDLLVQVYFFPTMKKRYRVTF